MSNARNIGKTTGTNTGDQTSLPGGVTGSVLYQSGVGVTAMTAAGTTGQVLTTLTTGANPTWQTPTGGGVTSVTGTAPVVSSGGTTPAISMYAATASVDGYMTSTYATKLDGISAGATTNTGTVTSVAALTLGTTGTDVGSTVATGTTTPVITLNIPTASASNRGALSSTDWTTFNNKQVAGAYLTTAVTSVGGTGTVSGLTLTGTVTSTGSLTLGGTLSLGSLNTLGNAGTASKLAATHTIGMTGDVSWSSGAFDGSTDVTATSTLATITDSGTGTFKKITTNTKGLVTGNTAVVQSDITGLLGAGSISNAMIANGAVANLSGTNTGDQTFVTGNAGTVTNGLYSTGSYSNPTWLPSVTLTTGTITTAPTSSNDIVNKSYADSIATGVNFHAACNYATTAALNANTYANGTLGVGATLTGNSNGAISIDGFTPTVGQRVLIKNEVTQSHNGAYTVTQVGTGSLPYILTRATDFDTSGSGTNEIDQGDMLLVLAGTTNNNTSWVQQTVSPITVGTTSLVFLQFAAIQTYAAGTGLTLSTNQFSITNAGTSGTYGSASLIPVITTNAQGQITGVTTASNPQGTVTSVAALTLGTTGTDVGSTVAGGSGAAVITLNIPTASATNRGALSSADWSTFNGKQAAGSYLTAAVTSVGFTGGIITVNTPTAGAALVVAGTSGGIPYFSSTSAWASSALLTANALMIAHVVYFDVIRTAEYRLDIVTGG